VTDLITGPVGYASTPVSSDQVPSSAFEGQDWYGTTKWAAEALSRGYEMSQEMGVAPADSVSFSPPAPQPQQPLLTPEEANAQYGIKSQNGEMPDLTFDKPISDSAAASMSADWHEKMLRQDALARAPGGIVNGLGRWGVGMAAFLLDPVNLAASFMPIVSEARVGAALANAGFGGLETSLAGRTAMRMATGFVAGSANFTPIIGLRYGLSQLEGHDYGAADAMADIISGGVGVAGLHTLVGGALDIFGRGFRATPEAGVIDTDPVAREAALRTAVAQVADGRSVDIRAPVNIAALEDAQGILAYHGSASSFRQFEQNKINSGEGSQTEGHGFYVAQNPEVGKSYQMQLGFRNATVEGQPLDPNNPTHVAAVALHNYGPDRASTIQELETEPQTPGTAAALAMLRSDTPIAQLESGGHLYTVRVKAQPNEVIDLDKDLGEQSNDVKAAFASAGITEDSLQGRTAYRLLAYKLFQEEYGMSVHTEGGFAATFGKPGYDELASRYLRMQGIKAMSYLDQGSREAGEGTRNFVVFHANDLDVTHRDGQSLRDMLHDLAGSPEFAAAKGAPSAGDLATSQTASRAATEAATELKTERPELAPDISERLAEQEARFKQFRGEGETEGADGTRGMLTPAERAEMNQLDEEFSQQKKDAGLWQDAAACFLDGA
jgi:hypothetical protein